jgi:hypothetical protein
MKSGARNHFPPTVYQNRKRVLWNRIERKPLVNRPEERVRLRYIDFLTLECGWSASRIASESAISVYNRDSQLRADLICYDKQMKPSILIECKSESISLSHKAAAQAALYNSELQAELICITNGIDDLWFKNENTRVQPLDQPPLKLVQTVSSIRKNPEYWEKRGFLGSNIGDQIKEDLAELLRVFWSGDFGWETRYLQIQHTIPEFSFEQYYRVIDLDSNTRIAMSFIAGREQNSHFVAIFNQDGNNRALLISDLNKTLSGHQANSHLITNSGSQPFDLRRIIPFRFPHFKSGHIANIPGFLNSFFLKSI